MLLFFIFLKIFNNKIVIILELSRKGKTKKKIEINNISFIKIFRQRQDSNLRGITAKGFQVLLLNHSDTLPYIYIFILINNNNFIISLQKKTNKIQKNNIIIQGQGEAKLTPLFERAVISYFAIYCHYFFLQS